MVLHFLDTLLAYQPARDFRKLAIRGLGLADAGSATSYWRRASIAPAEGGRHTVGAFGVSREEQGQFVNCVPLLYFGKKDPISSFLFALQPGACQWITIGRQAGRDGGTKARKFAHRRSLGAAMHHAHETSLEDSLRFQR